MANGKSKIDPKDFVKYWQSLDETEEIANKLGTTREKVIQLASIYRRKGVPLKKMKKGPSKTDLTELVTLAKKYSKSSDRHVQ